MTGSADTPSFRLAYVPGVTPGKWVKTWNERLPDIPLALVPVTADEAPATLRDLGADAGFVRLPVDRTELSAIPLYTEASVVVLPKDHLFAAAEEVTPEDLADEIVLHPLDDTLDWERPPGRPAVERPATTADAIELVAAGVGLLVVPMSLARLHHRRDLTYRIVTGTPQSQVALSWRTEETTPDLVEDFIGIVRGRTVNSSRGRRADQDEKAAGKGEKSDKGGRGAKPSGGKPKGQGGRQQGGARKAAAAKPRRTGGGSGKPRRRS
ncbi:LysR family substrate-binding domain-containing protein [Streptomyces sp. NPDC001941]|uniref:LysR family substrate-binding domain-containing protein n=1 Tax=Streptomyces sp. NPDC001941 TaxID=3154659 RepID=UPI00331C21EF